MLALSIRQPFAELILRGLKTVEFRSRPTRIIGERFYIYASARKWTSAGDPRSEGEGQIAELTRALGNVPGSLTSDNLVGGSPPDWMIELAAALRLFPKDLPRGVIVGSAVIDRCEPAEPRDPSQPAGNSAATQSPVYHWHLADVHRLSRPRKPQRQPQPVWFKPFQ